ncbi:MAG TPA: anti-sigma factor [Gaiellaceae bacterium]|nr:anti-sigma factor [Gaiellaceae bacterium]
MTHEPRLEELIGAEETGSERERLQHVHELLLQAGPPHELTPELEAGPTLAMTLGRSPRRRIVKQRAMLLLAATLALALVFFAGYVSGPGGGSGVSTGTPRIITLAATSAEPGAHGTLQVWHPHDGNWPMALTVAGLHPLPLPRYYEVYVVRDGKILGSCGQFRVKGTGPVKVNLTAPYPLQHGDTWVVTREGAGGAEPGTTVLRPTVSA